ncbi:S-layer homology domain-containing protein [Laspinema olomoucense]|uniref:S-layer homology domain-containing protein n=1 Tax=Laspinema olomoucense D3b TaxID=2953688 RepID=A0ABT2N933_9CYAN|nr:MULTISPECIES: S-layer homology domain-containing protein [unclassified Laspinema]MCT7975815.1 S-layer homology domain-containing protein [Laspinema sp. D3d]MCT7979208.1 S-layer homology domain-containing protein [Laspinema sp. D3b]
MVFSLKWPLAILSSIVLGVTAGLTIPDLWKVETASAQGQQPQKQPQQTQQKSSFPDVQPNYWASPFIEGLAQEDIVAGYPDGTFRPNQNIEREEFAALIRQAFEVTEKRQISSGSEFNDVPENHWAVPAIEEAYQGGFMNAFSNNKLFYPQREMTRAEAITSLAQGLQLVKVRPAATAAQAGDRTSPSSEGKRPVAKRQLAFPVAFTAMMQPLLLIQRANAQPPSQPGPSVEEPTQQSFVTKQPTPDLTAYYTDADRIPSEATDPILAATQANIVVNHPDPSVLNPTDFLSRGSAAAMIYQSLVHAGRMEPLPDNSAANQYIVEPPAPKQP